MNRAKNFFINVNEILPNYDDSVKIRLSYFSPSKSYIREIFNLVIEYITSLDGEDEEFKRSAENNYENISISIEYIEKNEFYLSFLYCDYTNGDNVLTEYSGVVTSEKILMFFLGIVEEFNQIKSPKQIERKTANKNVSTYLEKIKLRKEKLLLEKEQEKNVVKSKNKADTMNENNEKHEIPNVKKNTLSELIRIKAEAKKHQQINENNYVKPNLTFREKIELFKKKRNSGKMEETHEKSSFMSEKKHLKNTVKNLSLNKIFDENMIRKMALGGKNMAGRDRLYYKYNIELDSYSDIKVVTEREFRMLFGEDEMYEFSDEDNDDYEDNDSDDNEHLYSFEENDSECSI